MGEVAVGQLIAELTPLGLGDDEAAAAEAGEVVADVRAAEAKFFGHGRRVGRAIEEHQQDAATVRIGQGPTQSAHGFEPCSGVQHRLNYTARR